MVKSWQRIGGLGLLALAALQCGCTRASSTVQAGSPLKLVAELPLPGSASRFDYQSFDPTSGRLYIAHLDANRLIVFDTSSRQVVGDLDGFAHVHGVLVVPELNRVFASVTGEHKLAMVDTKSLKTLGKFGPVRYPDGLAYAPGQKRIFISDEHGDADIVFDADADRFLKRIELGGGAGNTVYDPVAGRIMVSVHHRNELVTIDPEKMEITGTLALPGIRNPHGIALDAPNRLAFIAGEENHMLAVVDLTQMKVLGTYPVGKDPDVLAFDPGLKLLYISAESGDVWIYRENGKALEAMGHLTMPHAHTISVDPTTHLVYFPLESMHGKPVLRIMSPDAAE